MQFLFSTETDLELAEHDFNKKDAYLNAIVQFFFSVFFSMNCRNKWAQRQQLTETDTELTQKVVSSSCRIQRIDSFTKIVVKLTLIPKLIIKLTESKLLN